MNADHSQDYLDMASDKASTLHILVLPGDGIGPEISSATRRMLEAAEASLGLGLVFEESEIGFAALKSSGTTFPASTWEKAKTADGIILGPVSHNEYPPRSEGGLNPSGELRIRLDLFANIRPARTRQGLPHASRTPFDLVIVRENTEGFYADRSMFLGPGEYMPTPDLALATRKITRGACMRIAEEGFRLASQRRKKLVAVHKANVMRVSDGLFLECTREVAQRYSSIAYEEQLVDSMAALLVRDASVFDVVVTTNMFGDILSDEAAELAGGLGLGASLNAGVRSGVAQAQHGSAPSLAGKDVANPVSLINSSAMLLAWLGERHSRPVLVNAAALIEQAVDQTISNPETRTRDLGGTLGTSAFTSAVLSHIDWKHALKAV
jgi:isocitrate/isopropylmalate dehydrogenase